MAAQTPDDSHKVDIADAESAVNGSSHSPRDSKGWDGKLRVDRRAVVTNPNAMSDAEDSDGDEAPPQEQIDADEDLLDDYPLDTEDIDLVHCRISSIEALRLERFTRVEVRTRDHFAPVRLTAKANTRFFEQRLCLRQNSIQDVEGLSHLGSTLKELDLYDNLISHIKGLTELVELTSLDFSFNKIKHIKNIGHLRNLRDVYFVQNKIGKIEGLEGLTKLRNLELAANRIREIENLESLTSLQELWLGKNKITQFKNLSSLTNLKIISIQSNRLTSIQGLEKLTNLEELYLSHNAIESLSGIEHNTNLRVLDISNNRISHLSHLSTTTRLEEFWASTNEISSFEEVESQLRDKEKLETVYFEGNPLQTRGPAVYRNKVRLALPQVNQIDASKSCPSC
ncbi:MAG: hypothetical protein M1825_000483 [Sarcosagium campestre]|nr:MAG: hypothetical protein M1825_000483 [Sarcosagium campestre]